MISRIKLLLAGWKRKLFGPRKPKQTEEAGMMVFRRLPFPQAPAAPSPQSGLVMLMEIQEAQERLLREPPGTPQWVLKQAWDEEAVKTHKQMEACRQKPSSMPPAKIPTNPVIEVRLERKLDELRQGYGGVPRRRSETSYDPTPAYLSASSHASSASHCSPVIEAVASSLTSSESGSSSDYGSFDSGSGGSDSW